MNVIIDVHYVQYLSAGIERREAVVQRADEAEDDHEELEQRHGHDHEVDGERVHLLVDLAARVHEGEVVPVHEVLEHEVEEAEGCDEGAGHGEHDDHGEDEHHPGVLLPKPELVLDRLPDGGGVRLAAGHTDLHQVPEQLREPDYSGSKSSIRRFVIMEKAPRAFFWFKLPSH